MIDSVSNHAGGVADLRNARRKPAAQSSDRLPPYAEEAERGVLGCMLLSPSDCISQCIEKFKEGPEAFYDLRHQTIYMAMLEMQDSGEPIDIITIQQFLKDRKLLEQIGGITYLNALQDSVPSSANVSYYADIVHEKYVLRKLIQNCSDIVGKAYEHEGDLDALIDEAEADILKVGNYKLQGVSRSSKEFVGEAIGMMEKYLASGGGVCGIPTGFTDLDKLTCGMMPKDMIVIAARPSMGKTSLAMNIVEHVAIELKQPVGVFSLEMSGEMLMLRALCSRARVNLNNVRRGYIVESDFPKIAAASRELSDAPIHIDDTGGLTISQLRAKARRMVQQHKVKLFVIDYMQLLHAPAKGRDDGRQQEITRISSGIKEMAKELGVPVIVLSQLNRDMEKGAGKTSKPRKPRISDLRESGSIEQDADLIGLLYRDNEDETSNVVNLLIGKQRNGPTGDIELAFLKEYTRYENAAKITGEDVP